MTQISQVPHRSGMSRSKQCISSRQSRNISEREQWLSLVAGSAMVVYGLSKRSLDDAPEMYRIFEQKQDNCVKVALKP